MTTEQTMSPPRAGVGIAAQGLGQGVRSGRQILHNISLGIAPGELVASIGASGAGKTTLLEILAGVRTPTAGTVTYDGIATADAIGVVPQDDISYAMSNRWAFEGLGHTAGVQRLCREGGSPLGPPLLATYGDSFSRPVWVDWLALSGFVVLFLGATWAVLAGRDSRRVS